MNLVASFPESAFNKDSGKMHVVLQHQSLGLDQKLSFMDIGLSENLDISDYIATKALLHLAGILILGQFGGNYFQNVTQMAE